LYSIDVQLPDERYKGMAGRMAFYNALTARMARVPGVEGVTLAAASPSRSSFLIGALQLEGQPEPPVGTTAFIEYNGVLPEFFRLMRMRIVEGTTFTDTSDAAGQALINEGMARKYWPGTSPIGRKLRVVYNGHGKWKTVVGVVSNALTQGLTHNAGAPLLYLPGPGMFHASALVRTSSDAAIIPAFRSLVANIDSRLPPPLVTNAEDAMQRTIARPHYTMLLLVVFTLVAIGLAAVGLYGVLAYTVAQRTREIGIRMALGASRRAIARSVMQQGVLLAAVGGVIGLIAARWGVKLLGSMLYGIRETDIVSFFTGAAVLLVIAVVACLVPVRRAVSVDPLIAMRAE
jgi:putative ABC transport system permease protein